MKKFFIFHTPHQSLLSSLADSFIHSFNNRKSPHNCHFPLFEGDTGGCGEGFIIAYFFPLLLTVTKGKIYQKIQISFSKNRKNK